MVNQVEVIQTVQVDLHLSDKTNVAGTFKED